MKKIVILCIVMALLAGMPNVLHAQEKSAVLALGLSVFPSVIGCRCGLYNGQMSLLLPSFFIAPSLGHFYAGQWKIGLTFIGLRSLTMAGAMWLVSGSDSVDEKIATHFLAICACCGLVLADWIAVPYSVREYNKRFQIEPTINLQDGNYGLGFSYHF